MNSRSEYANKGGIMDNKKVNKKGGFHFGNVKGDVKIRAGGNIVAGDLTVIEVFKDEKDKEDFSQQINELRNKMRQIKSQVDDIEELDEEFKDQIILEIMQQLSDLSSAQKEAASFPVGKGLPKHKVDVVSRTLDKTNTLMGKLQKIGEKSAAFAQSLAPIAATLLSVRQLFSVP
jgi:DNA repair exonuclease SbcCD ATPase subunit